MCWIVMANPSPSQVPPNGTLEAPLPPVRGFFFVRWVEGRRAVLECLEGHRDPPLGVTSTG